MPSRDTNTTDTTAGYQPIDAATSVAICRAVGERLRQGLVADTSGLPPHLQYLLEQLRSRETTRPPDMQ